MTRVVELEEEDVDASFLLLLLRLLGVGLDSADADAEADDAQAAQLSLRRPRNKQIRTIRRKKGPIMVKEGLELVLGETGAIWNVIGELALIVMARPKCANKICIEGYPYTLG